eukprot:2427803-Rhodomonas_salina.1
MGIGWTYTDRSFCVVRWRDTGDRQTRRERHRQADIQTDIPPQARENDLLEKILLALGLPHGRSCQPAPSTTPSHSTSHVHCSQMWCDAMCSNACSPQTPTPTPSPTLGCKIAGERKGGRTG